MFTTLIAVYVAGLVATGFVSYRNSHSGASNALTVLAHLAWPVVFVGTLIYVWFDERSQS